MFVKKSSYNSLAIRKRIFKLSGILLNTRFFIIATRLNSNRSEIARNLQNLLHLRFVKASYPTRSYTSHQYDIPYEDLLLALTTMHRFGQWPHLGYTTRKLLGHPKNYLHTRYRKQRAVAPSIKRDKMHLQT